jgi:hypothetical protein
MPVRRVLCKAAVWASLTALPAATYAQSPEPAAFELGGTFNGFLVIKEDPTLYPTFGVRATIRASTLWAAQFDVDMPMPVTSVGRYGVRLRYWPASSTWYGFGGLVGTFILPDEGRYYERPGSFRWPHGVRFGAGRRVLSHGQWGMLVEEELAFSVYGGVSVSAGLEVTFAARRASGR